MISTIMVPAHWKNADIQDIYRELVGLITNIENMTCTEGMPSELLRDVLQAMRAPELFFDMYRVSGSHAIEIRRSLPGANHHRSKRGWTQLMKSRVIHQPGYFVEVRWQASKRPDKLIRLLQNQRMAFQARVPAKDQEWDAIEF